MDLGIKDFAVASDGEKIPNPRKLARRVCLARYQRRLARCQKGSANRVKAKAKVARAHRKVRASRADFLHRASTRLVREHDVLVVEDLAVRNMTRRPAPRPDPDPPGAHLPNGAAAKAGLNKSIHDAGWGEFRQPESPRFAVSHGGMGAGTWWPVFVLARIWPGIPFACDETHRRSTFMPPIQALGGSATAEQRDRGL